MSGPIAGRARRIVEWLAGFALPLIAVAIALAYVGYGVSECRGICSAYGASTPAERFDAGPGER